MSEEIEHDDAEEGDIGIMPCFDDTMCERRVFLDEIHEVAQWEKVVRQLHSRENTDVFITGSND